MRYGCRVGTGLPLQLTLTLTPTLPDDRPSAHPTRHPRPADVRGPAPLLAPVPLRPPRHRGTAPHLDAAAVPPHPAVPLRGVGREVPPHLGPGDRLAALA